MCDILAAVTTLRTLYRTHVSTNTISHSCVYEHYIALMCLRTLYRPHVSTNGSDATNKSPSLCVIVMKDERYVS